jgi:hypothetical protein
VPVLAAYQGLWRIVKLGGIGMKYNPTGVLMAIVGTLALLEPIRDVLFAGVLLVGVSLMFIHCLILTISEIRG